MKCATEAHAGSQAAKEALPWIAYHYALTAAAEEAKLDDTRTIEQFLDAEFPDHNFHIDLWGEQPDGSYGRIFYWPLFDSQEARNAAFDRICAHAKKVDGIQDIAFHPEESLKNGNS